MAREKMITRTMKVTHVDVMVVDIVTAEVRTITTDLTNFMAVKDKLLYLKKLYDSDTDRVVTYTVGDSTDVLYGMSESNFIKYGTLMPPRASAE